MKIRCEIVPGKVEITMCKAHYRYRKRATDKTVMEPVRYHLMSQKYVLQSMPTYPSLAEGDGLENRQIGETRSEGAKPSVGAKN